MNRYLADRFEEIADALPSASPETLLDIKFEMERLLSDIEDRLEAHRSADESLALASATIHPMNGVRGT